MKVIRFPFILYCITFFFLLNVSCKKEEVDPCMRTQWLQTKEPEIKLAVYIKTTNPDLRGGTAGSLSPVDFEKMMVSGTIEKVECNEETTGPINLGNSYIIKGVDSTAPIDIPEAYWIGYVVYVFEFDNDKDYININLTVKITMKDNQSYVCNVNKVIYYPQILRMPMEMYYYIPLEIYSDNWIKV